MMPDELPAQRWQYFTRAEFACRCGCGQNRIDDRLVDALEALRRQCGFPLPIASGYRCPKHNAKVSSTGKTGPHTTGLAADISVSRHRAHEVLRYALPWFSGIGIQQKGEGRFIHLDLLQEPQAAPRPTVWSY